MQFPDDYRRFLKADDWQVFRDNALETDQRKGVNRPAPQKPYPEDAKLVDFPSPQEVEVGTMSVREVIGRRKSRRSFSSEPVSLQELSYLLWATQGVREKRDLPAGGVATFRNVPSGGSLHSFETYLFVRSVVGLPAGLYRYLPIEHKLLPVSEKVSAEQVAEGCAGQRFAGEGAVTFIWTTIPYRMEWRYSIVAHKVIAIDAGHVCQNLYLAAESIGCGTCAIAAYDQGKMDELLGVDGTDEFTIYIAPVGKVP